MTSAILLLSVSDERMHCVYTWFGFSMFVVVRIRQEFWLKWKQNKKKIQSEVRFVYFIAYIATTPHIPSIKKAEEKKGRSRNKDLTSLKKPRALVSRNQQSSSKIKQNKKAWWIFALEMWRSPRSARWTKPWPPYEGGGGKNETTFFKNYFFFEFCSVKKSRCYCCNYGKSTIAHKNREERVPGKIRWYRHHTHCTSSPFFH